MTLFYSQMRRHVIKIDNFFLLSFADFFFFPSDNRQIIRPMTFYRPIVGRQSPDTCHLSPAARRTDGRSRATVPTYISRRLHYTHHILCHGVCGNASVVADGGNKLIVQLLEPYYLYWMRGHPRVVWSVDGRGTIEKDRF